MIRVSDLHFAFSGRTLFSGLDFNVEQGEVLSLIGPNGCGKSTLLRLLRGTLKATRGTIHWQGREISRIPARSMARRVAVVPQSALPEFPYSIRELVTMGRFPHARGFWGIPERADRQAVEQALALTDLLDLAEQPVTQLSGGELQRTLLARALAQDTEVLFLDEATSHLDIDHRLELTELLTRLNREQGLTIVQISHDLDLAANVSRRILMLTASGRIAALGPPREVMTAASLQQVFRVDVRVATNPLTGAPQILPLLNTSGQRFDDIRVHLICGGGSGRTLLRRLHLGGARITTGPLNRGDSDELLARALDIPITTAAPFSPFAPDLVERTRQALDSARVLIVTTRWWGPGNLACLDLAETALTAGKPVYLSELVAENDLTEGQATRRIADLKHRGAIALTGEDLLLDALQRLERA